MPDVTTKDYNWTSLCREMEGPAFDEKATEYEFSNGRTFDEPRVLYQSPIPVAPIE